MHHVPHHLICWARMRPPAQLSQQCGCIRYPKTGDASTFQILHYGILNSANFTIDQGRVLLYEMNGVICLCALK